MSFCYNNEFGVPYIVHVKLKNTCYSTLPKILFYYMCTKNLIVSKVLEAKKKGYLSKLAGEYLSDCVN